MKNIHEKPQILTRKTTKILVVLSFVLVSISVLPANAASLNLISPVSEIGIGQRIYVDLMLDTEESDINAVQGTINFPGDILKFDSLNDGDSIITFWVERPHTLSGQLVFSGVIPGGFSGVLSPYYQGARPGKILRLYFIAKTNGSALIKLTDAKVLLNDGKGTEADLKISNFRFAIHETPLIETRIDTKEDVESPEDFRPEIVSDPNLFNGKYVLVWIAKDKGSGIDYYEIAEERGSLTLNYAELLWQTAESPYILKDQKLKSYIYVKAVDRAGNIRIVYLPPSYVPWYKKPLVDIIGGLVLLIVLLLTARWLWRLLSKKH